MWPLHALELLLLQYSSCLHPPPHPAPTPQSWWGNLGHSCTELPAAPDLCVPGLLLILPGSIPFFLTITAEISLMLPFFPKLSVTFQKSLRLTPAFKYCIVFACSIISPLDGILLDRDCVLCFTLLAPFIPATWVICHSSKQKNSDLDKRTWWVPSPVLSSYVCYLLPLLFFECIASLPLWKAFPVVHFNQISSVLKKKKLYWDVRKLGGKCMGL